MSATGPDEATTPSTPSVTEAGLARRPGRDLCSVQTLSRADAREILVAARRLAGHLDAGQPLAPALRDRVVLSMFNEPSTRTRTSFEIAAKRIGADVVGFAGDANSSFTKGETMADTVLNLDAMGLDVIVVRDTEDGLPERICAWSRARVVNAGDGRRGHPTQALLDALTLVDAFDVDLTVDKPFSGLRVAIIGDIDNGRVGKSDTQLFTALGAEVRLAGLPSILSEEIGARLGAPVFRDLDQAIDGVDAVVMLRIQRERLASDVRLPDPITYHRDWGLDARRMARVPNAILMHPGPINRGVEIDDEVLEGPRARVMRQVTLGVPVRIVTLARACGVSLESLDAR